MKVTTVGLDLAKSVLQVHEAVAHRLLMLSYHLLSRRVAYTELGTDYVDRQQVERQRRRLMRIGRGLREPCLQLPYQLVDIALAGAAHPQESDLRLPSLANLRYCDRLLMDIQSDEQCASVSPG
jgi:hypothetical protein